MSYAYTCAVSGLPIHDGDPVRYFLLTKNPYRERATGINDIWFPRTWPIRGHYNDGGYVEIEESPIRNTWLEGFQHDLVEQCWGENSVHDVSTSKDMDWDRLLSAIHSNRIRVRSYNPYDSICSQFDELFPKEIPEGVPTADRIAAIIVANGFEVFDGHHGESQIMIDDDDGYGRIRLRVGDFGSSIIPLERLNTALTESGYACMHTAGTGSYAHASELLVRPRPEIADYHFCKRDLDDPDRSFPVDHALIREDVWQSLVAMDIPDWRTGDMVSAQVWRDRAIAAWEVCIEEIENDGVTGMLATLSRSDNQEMNSFLDSDIPFMVGLGEAFEFVTRRADELSENQRIQFQSDAGEFVHITIALAMTRYLWRPSYGNGPQFGNWGMHHDVLSRFADIAKSEYGREQSED